MKAYDCDLLKERGDVVDTKKLSQMLGVPVLEVSALRNTNLDELVKSGIEAAKRGDAPGGVSCFSSAVEAALEAISAAIKDKCKPELVRWYSIKLFERDTDAK